MMDGVISPQVADYVAVAVAEPSPAEAEPGLAEAERVPVLRVFPAPNLFGLACCVARFRAPETPPCDAV